jgi:hypothetical protein
VKRATLLGLLLIGAAQAAPYAWKGEVKTPFRAPTDQLMEGALRGAALQGGLVDIRYGQVAVDLGGVAEVLETDERSILTLDGAVISAEELLKHIPDDLAVAVRFAPETGKVGWLDAFSGGESLPGAALGRVPAKPQAYAAGELVTLTMTRRERQRLGGDSYTATIPGVAHDLPFVPMRDGGSKATLRVMPGWNFRDVPVWVKAVRGNKPKVYRGPRLSFSTTAPSVIGFGPEKASHQLEAIPGWVDLRSESGLLDPASALLTVSPGLKVLSFQPRVDRSVFELKADRPGDYWVELRMADRLGRKAVKRWTLKVLP